MKDIDWQSGLVPTIWGLLSLFIAWLSSNVWYHGKAVARIDQRLDDMAEKIDDIHQKYRNQ